MLNRKLRGREVICKYSDKGGRVMSAKDKLNKKFNALNKAIDEENWQKAIELADWLLENDTHKPSIILSLKGVALSMSGDHKTALDVFNEGLKLDTLNTAILTQRSIVKEKLNNLSGAISDLDVAIYLTDAPTELISFKAEMLLRVGRNEEALRALDRVIAEKPKDPDLLYKRAFTKHHLQDNGGALEDIKRVIDLLQQNENIVKLINCFGLRGSIYVFEKKFYEAIVDFTDGLELDENHLLLRELRAIAYLETEQYEESISDLDKLLMLKDSADFLMQRGVSKGFSGDHEGALIDFSHAIEIDSSSAQALVNLGLAKKELGSR